MCAIRWPGRDAARLAAVHGDGRQQGATTSIQHESAWTCASNQRRISFAGVARECLASASTLSTSILAHACARRARTYARDAACVRATEIDNAFARVGDTFPSGAQSADGAWLVSQACWTGAVAHSCPQSERRRHRHPAARDPAPRESSPIVLPTCALALARAKAVYSTAAHRSMPVPLVCTKRESRA